jgi:hypothetical protein
MFVLFVSLLCLVPRLLCLWIINVCFVCLLAVSCPTITLSMIINVCFVCLPAMSCPTITLSMDYQCLLCLSPCCVLSNDCFVYGLSMFALFVSVLGFVPRLLCLWIINVCFVCLRAVFCPTITLSMDYQWLLCLYPCCVLSHDYFHRQSNRGTKYSTRQTKQTLIIHRQSNRGTKHSTETNKTNIDKP